MEKKLLSIVIPIFNEEENIQELYHEFVPILKKLTFFTEYEIIAVNDGSKDCSLEILKSIAAKDRRLKTEFRSNLGGNRS